MERSGEHIEILVGRERDEHSMNEGVAMGNIKCAGEWGGVPQFYYSKGRMRDRARAWLEAEYK